MSEQGRSRTEYPPEVKAAAMAALLAGQSINQVAGEYQIPRGTVAAWAGQVRGHRYANPVSEASRERIGELIVDNLEAALEATREMARVFANPTWLKKQTAQELAIVYGVVSDKVYRLLEALGDEEGAEDTADLS